MLFSSTALDNPAAQVGEIHEALPLDLQNRSASAGNLRQIHSAIVPLKSRARKAYPGQFAGDKRSPASRADPSGRTIPYEMSLKTSTADPVLFWAI